MDDCDVISDNDDDAVGDESLDMPRTMAGLVETIYRSRSLSQHRTRHNAQRDRIK